MMDISAPAKNSPPRRTSSRAKKAFKWSLYSILGLCSLVVLAAAALYWWWDSLPYQQHAARQITQALEAQGLKVRSITVESLSQKEAVLTDITLGDDETLHIDQLSTHYQWQQAVEGKFQRLTLQKPEITLYSAAKGWSVGGLEPLSDNAAPSSSEPLPSLPFMPSELEALLPDMIGIEDASLTIRPATGHLTMPFSADFTLKPEPSLTLNSAKLTGQNEDIALTSGPLKISAALASHHSWDGTFSLAGLHITGAPVPLPPLILAGSFSLSQQQFTLQITASDKAKTHGGAFSLTLPLAHMRKGKIQLSHLHFPWGGGMIRTKNVTIPLQDKAAIPVTLHLEAIELSQLLDTIGGEKITGTGRISGSLPITWHANGKITLQQGVASALEDGTLSVSPDALPGDREEMQTVRTALENFHYTSLQIAVSSDEADKSVIALKVQGNNPNAFNGRQVNLNVSLSGDVLPLLQQSILPFQDIQTWLKQQDAAP